MAGNHESSDTPNDPRGCGFRSRTTVEAMLALIDSTTRPVDAELISGNSALGRVLAESVISQVNIPSFDRAAMDGFALKAEETFGADLYTPAQFTLIGRSRPGTGYNGQVSAGQAVAIATGAPIPPGANCVVPVEFTEVKDTLLFVRSSVTPGRHVGKTGEDVWKGSPVMDQGRVLRPQEIGLLAGLGIQKIKVLKKPGIAVIATGDEIRSDNERDHDSQYKINNMNSPMLSALICRDGGEPIQIGPLADDPAILASTLHELSACNDIHGIMINGGSSAGPEDHAPGVIANLGRLLAHGVALRPASPTGFGLVGGKPVLLTPGNPVSCLCAYDFFGRLIVRKLAGLSSTSPYPVIRRKLAHKLSSSLGRVDYVRVQIINETNEIEVIATSGASILSGTTRATGFLIVPADLEGYPAETLVNVHCYDTFQMPSIELP